MNFFADIIVMICLFVTGRVIAETVPNNYVFLVGWFSGMLYYGISHNFLK